jgi:methyl-accepting chemotaxis protein
MDVIWSGADEYLDEKLGTNASEYSIRFVRRMVSSEGILVIDVSTKTIDSILKNINFDETGILGIVTNDGKEILLEASQERVFSDKDFYEEAIKDAASSGSKYVDYNGGKYLFTNSKIGNSGAMICALVPKSTILKQAADIRSFTLIIVIIASIIAILTGFTISNGINKAITGIISGLRRASQGDLTVEFPTKRKDEFKVLIHEIENTFSNMKTIIFGVKSISGEVLQSSEQVAAATTTFQRSTENISFAMGEVEQGITQQAKDAEGCLIEMDNLSQKIITISDNSKEIGRITEQTKTSIYDGTLCTERLNEQTKSTILITTDIIKKVEAHSQNSLSIGQISNVISNIATQINLLSLNASIESARAGEFGKGFAVIATEIRNLAEQSKRSVDEIKAIIGKIQEDTKETMLIAGRVEDVLSLQESAVTDTIDSYHNINQNVEQLVIYLKYITDSVNTMEISRTSTLGAIESISAVLEEIAASSNTVNQASKEQLSSVDTLGSSSEALYTNADKLLQAVQKFIV